MGRAAVVADRNVDVHAGQDVEPVGEVPPQDQRVDGHVRNARPTVADTGNVRIEAHDGRDDVHRQVRAKDLLARYPDNAADCGLCVDVKSRNEALLAVAVVEAVGRIGLDVAEIVDARRRQRACKRAFRAQRIDVAAAFGGAGGRARECRAGGRQRDGLAQVMFPSEPCWNF